MFAFIDCVFYFNFGSQRLHPMQKEGDRELISVRATTKDGTTKTHQCISKRASGDGVFNEYLQQKIWEEGKRNMDEPSWEYKLLYGMFPRQIQEVAEILNSSYLAGIHPTRQDSRYRQWKKLPELLLYKPVGEWVMVPNPSQ